MKFEFNWPSGFRRDVWKCWIDGCRSDWFTTPKLLVYYKLTHEPSAQMSSEVSMIRQYHNHALQTNPRNREEEPQNTNSHKTSGRQLK